MAPDPATMAVTQSIVAVYPSPARRCCWKGSGFGKPLLQRKDHIMVPLVLWLLGVPLIAVVLLMLLGIF
ncbi:hypothetical protein WG922_01435 [Ramlibacter sp. AN1015]|uniref:hypothetical protein n=1 Tax=Ramlibacter sp. AN1015 TaxID=3133428 RepID=UPI0030C60D11